ncbi:hypothetical protein [Bradyrhizobium sp. Tv2a-2]|uniref:hypothetical protein n=1 Tax=Bradyrhizobium sp. Tv2a-2 TaxID=113395 RepID=UPI00056B125E|nr:hypothetical protein [Bradyrhizobium sp. Tv2a-2]
MIPDEMIEAGARALWRSSIYQGYNDEVKEMEWLRMAGIWRRQVSSILEAINLPEILNEHEVMRRSLEIITGSAADGLQRTQAIGALSNIGPRVSNGDGGAR